MARAVPFTLHQKVMFVGKEQLISVAVEENVVATLTISNLYIDVDENTAVCSFQSFEVVNATFVHEGKKISTPRLSKVTKMGVKQTVGKGSISWIRAWKVSARGKQSYTGDHETRPIWVGL